MSEARIPRGLVALLAALLIAAPAAFAVAAIYRTDANGLVFHRHTVSYRVNNGILADTQLRDQADKARGEWDSDLKRLTTINMLDALLPTAGNADVLLKHENTSDANGAVFWANAGYHPAGQTTVTFDSSRTGAWSASEKRGRACNALGNILGLADADDATRNDCMESPSAFNNVNDTSVAHVDAFYGPNASASGSMFDQRQNLKATRSYTFTGTATGHATKAVRVYLDGAATPIAQATQTPCGGKCSLSASFTREGSELGDGQHTVRVVAENEFGKTREQTYTLNVETHTGIMRQYSFEQQELRDRTTLRVNVVNGNLVLEERDLAIPGTTLDLRLSRFYNSLPVREGGAERTTAFGTGWSMDTAEGVELNPLANGDVRFFGPSGYAVYFTKQVDGTYKTPTGLDADLTKRADNSGFDLDLDGSQERYLFNAQGQFTEHRDKKSNQKLSFEYSGSQLTRIVDTQERALNFTYTAGRLTKITDALGREWRYEYTSGRLTRAYVFFDDGDNQTLDILGDTEYRYDPQGRLSEIVDPREVVTRVNYESATSPRVASVVREPDDATLTATTGFEYLNTAPADCIPQNPTDEQRDREATVVTAPNGSATGADPDDWETTYCHDAESRARRVIDAEGKIQESEWTSQSNLESYASGSGATTSLKYTDTANPARLTRSAAPGGAATTLSYAGASPTSFNPTSVTDPQGKTTNFSYTGSGNSGYLKRIVSTLGTVVKLEHYTAPGQGDNPAPDPDWEGLLKSSSYKHTDAGSDLTTTYDYDGAGNLTEETPPPNAQGQALQGKTSYRYDAVSRVTHVIDGNQNTRRITYDHLDRPVLIEYLGQCPVPRDVSSCLARAAVPPQKVNEVRLIWDPNGNLDIRTDGRKNEGRSDQTDDFDYDALNRRTVDRLRSSREVRYDYDRNGNLTRLEYVSPNAGATTYAYNEINQVTSIQEPFRTGALAFTYNDDHELSEIDFPNGVTQQFKYLETDDKNDPNNPAKAEPTYIVEAVKAWSAGQNPGVSPPDIAYLSYDYDENTSGDFQQEQTALRQRVRDVLNDVTTTHDYDALNRLKSTDNAGSYERDFAYTYDLASNLTSATEAQTTTTYAYNAVNELKKIDGVDLPDATTYDANGNLDLLQGTDYLYKSDEDVPELRNRTLAIDPAGTAPRVDFNYSGETQAERIHKGSVEYIDSLLGTGAEDPDGPAEGPYYTRTDTGQALSMRTVAGSGSGDYYLIADPLGSTIALTGPTGQRAARYRYKPYGEVTTLSDGGTPPALPILFAGQYLDSETGLYKMGLRYYDPAYGRWTQKDPLNLFQDPKQANRYAYAGADPVNNADPSGADYCDTVEEVQQFVLPDALVSPPTVCGGGSPIGVTEFVEETAQFAGGCGTGAAFAIRSAGPAPPPTPLINAVSSCVVGGGIAANVGG